jgi:hypothetical protein
MARRRKFRRDVVEESTSTPFDIFRESRLTNVGSSSHCVKSLPVHLDSTTVLLERRSRKLSEEPVEPWRDHTRPVAERVELVLAEMTLAKKVAQLGSR